MLFYFFRKTTSLGSISNCVATLTENRFSICYDRDRQKTGKMTQAQVIGGYNHCLSCYPL